MKKALAFASLLSLLALLPARAADNMKAFPPADAGMVRYVLQLPQNDNESSLKVELMVGKTVQVDDKNTYFFSGSIKETIIEGWGFPRYDVAALGQMAGTLMAPDPRAPKVNRFVTLGGEPYLLRYNSRLPIVIYVPQGAEVRYRIWTAAPQPTAVEKG